MRDKVKRFISILMTALMLVNLMPVGALADGITSGGYQQATVASGNQTVYLYVKVTGNLNGLNLNKSGWCTVGKVTGLDMTAPGTYAGWYGSSDHVSAVSGISATSVGKGKVDRYEKNQSIDLSKVTWSSGTHYGFLPVSTGADDYVGSGWTWHLDGYIDIAQVQASYKIRYVDQDTGKVLKIAASGTGDPGTWIDHTAPRTLEGGYEIVKEEETDKTFKLEQIDNTFDIYYRRQYGYKVEYYYDDVKDDKKTETGSAWCKDVIRQYTDKTDVGYEIEKAENFPLTIGTDESKNVIKVYYKKIGCKVTYKPGDHGTFEAKEYNAKYGDNTPAFDGETTGEPGWTFAGWEPKVADKVTGDVTYTAKWEPDTKQKAEVIYITDGNGTLWGGPAIKKITQFVQIVTGKVVREDGSVIGDKLTTIPTYPKEGYEFDHWIRVTPEKTIEGAGSALTDEKARPLLNKADGLYQDTVFKAIFTKKTDLSYTVNYYWNGTTTKVADSKTITGKMFGEEVTESPIGADGYTPVSNDPKKIKIKANSADNVINFYYYKNVELEAKGDTKTYNGKEQSVSGFTGAPEEADFSTIKVGANGTDANTYPANFAEDTVGTVDKTEKYIVTKTTNGQLVINPRPVTLTSEGGSKPYDGTALTKPEVQIEGSFVDGEVLGIVAQGTVTDVSDGEVTNTIFFNPGANFKESNYNIVKNEGNLWITPRQVKLTSETASKPYDGTVLMKPEVQIEGSFVEGEVTDIKAKGEVTHVSEGEVTNTITFTKGDKFKADNYTITKKEGKLSITPLDGVVVTIKGRTKTVTYNGEEHTAWQYDVISISDPLYETAPGKVPNFWNKNAKGASGTDAGTYAMGWKAEDFENTNTNFSNVTFNVTDGWLKINPRPVTLTSASDEKVYDGTALTKKEVTASTGENEGFVKGQGATYDVTGSQTDVGESKNTFTYTLNKGTKADNYEIKTENGTLTVTPVTAKVTVTITGNTASEKYDGTEKTAKGYDVSISNPLYKESDFTYSGTAEVKGTDANTYPMGLTAANFTNKSANFTNVEFVVTDGSLTINKRNVVLTSETASKAYDGTPLTKPNVTVSTGENEGFVAGEVTDIKATGTITDVGSVTNEITFTKGEKFNEDNYAIEKKEGTLTITAADAEVIVTIAGNTDNVLYDGNSHSVNGYTVKSISNKLYTVDDFKFNGTDSVTQTNAGTYPMGLKAEQFSNNNENFKKVTFVVEDGSLTIRKRSVVLTSETASKEYDGTALTKPVVAVTGDGFVAGEVTDIKATGTITDVGSVTNEITFTKGEKFNEYNYAIEKKEGTLTITAAEAEVVVTIAGKTDNVLYDGSEKTAKGYDVSISNPLYKESDFTYSGTAEVKGTDANTYPMNLKAEQFSNTNKNFSKVTFVVEKDGQLVIEKRAVNLSSGTVSKTYDGTPLTSDMVTIEGDGFIEEEAWDVEAIGSVKDVSEGEVTNTITFKTSDKFNADNYTITKTEGKLKVTPRSVTLTSASDSKVYDGTPLTNDTVTAVGFVKGQGAEYNVTGTQTNVGSSDNEFTYELNSNTKADNYKITTKFGTLEVTPVTEEVIVTITGRTAEMPYDGKEHSVFGYDLTVSNALYNPKEDMQFNGIDADMTAKGTDAGTYPIGLTAEDFENKSKNFSKVTFVVTDGYVKINPRAVTLTSETAGKTYDGTALEKPVVTVGGDGFVEGQVTEIKATGSVTNAGSVANTITFTPVEEKFNEKNYNIQKTEGTLTIAKRSVLITSQSATKTYDGSALTRPAVTITGDGFVPGELAKAEATGSITNVGSTPNTIRYTTTGAFNAANYSIALSVGTLTVTAKPEPEPRRTFNLTISYVYQNGKRAAASYNRGGLKNGETFDITSPVIAGYTASETVVSGTIYNRDIKVTVIYTADGVNLDDYGVPLGLGNITMNVGDCFE